ncbi:unnamed protein product [Ranitomeya imitator]|uniref:Uncharacterized protein n=1 Tax=Ranitomeya imitator TaxID=111125 RepID=A0ABN9L9P7_9NEOB|nr:unnamed protein product [Ranitomeya imitator]
MAAALDIYLAIVFNGLRSNDNAFFHIVHILTRLRGSVDINVYANIPPLLDHEGRIGMVSIKLKEGKMFDGDAMFSHVTKYLPNYARPRFLRIQDALPVNSTYKQYKMGLVNDGFNLSCIKDPLYILDDTDRTYRPLDLKIYNDILGQKIKL